LQLLSHYFEELFLRLTGSSMRIFLRLSFILLSIQVIGQHSVARKWNEVLLEGIRNDYARPTIHARNLFHVSAAMYDAWAITTGKTTPYLVGNYVHGFSSPFEGFDT